MATVLPCIEKTTSIRNSNLETYLLVWLDASVNVNKEIKEARVKLKSTINHIQIFECVNECEEFIATLSSEDRITVIINRDLENEIVPRIYNLNHIISIYMYCSTDLIIEKSSANSKVRWLPIKIIRCR
jgi:hypothetical protein